MGHGTTGLNVPSSVLNLRELEILHNFSSFESKIQVLFVGEHKERLTRELLLVHKIIEFLYVLLESLLIGGVDDKDDTIDIIVVVLPVGSNGLLTSNIPHVKLEITLLLDVLDQNTYHRLDVEALSGLDSTQILLRHGLEDSSLSRVIKTQNNDLLFFLVLTFKAAKKS